jgi:ATP-dependent DNA helicase DinG
VVATATLALQHQLVERDIPRLVEAVAAIHPEVDTSYAVLKGRSNYACLQRIREGMPDDDQGTLVEVSQATRPSSLGKKVLELRAWAEQEAENAGSGERDRAPRHTDREWRQVSVSHRDCLGAARCPFGDECFVEAAREEAHRSHLIVTNHSLLAIDAIEGVPMIPDYDVVVVDEAHEVVARVTQAATDELLASDVDRASRRSRRYVETGDSDSSAADDLADAGDALGAAIAEWRWPTRWCWSATPRAPASRRTRRRSTPQNPTPGGRRRAARCRRSSSPPSGWRPGPRPMCSG